MNKLNTDERVKFVEINTDAFTNFLPNDDRFQEQWHHNNINSQAAWDITRGNSNTIIAVLDTGLQQGHAELSGARFLTGFDFVNNDNDPSDGDSHGTYVTGLIAATADNGFSGAGIAHNATILPVKVLNDTGSGSFFGIAQGIVYATEQGADVINMSLGGSGPVQAVDEALMMARNNNVIIIASAGNDGPETADMNYPGSSPYTISVAATNINNHRAFFSATGSAVDVAAPGNQVLTVGYQRGDNDLDFFGGTSAAAPIVSAVAGLAKSLDPELTHDEFLEILAMTSQDQVSFPDEDTPGRDDSFGWGVIDAQAALSLINPGYPILPARIEAQDFTANFDSTPSDLGDSVCDTGDADSQATDDLGGICNIGFTTAGEWLEYNVFVEKAGTFDLNLRLSSRRGGNISLEIDGVEVEEIHANTGNWRQYENHVVTTSLSRGNHRIRVNFIDGGINFNFIEAELLGITLPALIQAQDFNDSFDTTVGDRGDDVCDTGDTGSQATNDQNGICNIGWTEAGEWVEFNVFAEEQANYFINLRLASSPGADVSIDVDGSEVARVIVDSSGWQRCAHDSC